MLQANRKLIKAAGDSEIDSLTERVIELEHLLAISQRVPDERPHGLARMPYKVLVVFCRNAFVPLALLQEITSFDANYFPKKQAEVYLCHARKWARAYGITIKNRWGEGWFIEPADRQKLAGLLDLPSAENEISRRREVL